MTTCCNDGDLVYSTHKFYFRFKPPIGDCLKNSNPGSVIFGQKFLDLRSLFSAGHDRRSLIVNFRIDDHILNHALKK